MLSLQAVQAQKWTVALMSSPQSGRNSLAHRVSGG